MGVYIAAMDLPKECIECQFDIPDKDGYPRCVILHRFIIDGNTFSNCPLVEIKTPHGRLIDEDALIDDLIEQKIPFNARINESIIITPTILEAEE